MDLIITLNKIYGTSVSVDRNKVYLDRVWSKSLYFK